MKERKNQLLTVQCDAITEVSLPISRLLRWITRVWD